MCDSVTIPCYIFVSNVMRLIAKTIKFVSPTKKSNVDLTEIYLVK